ncbi:NF-X1-type zinc finger protein NFXL1-like [Corticium candelabrum]|uniref:NF-X1-type zinc finger protein NFXL1-like n=1 Tax=Corticium candelabrum TaxID=121492 RepID=UPI002E25B6B2|nr:NF-X1-type zinc finger protein NFXL1-like [Corticium candelabrum]
MSRPLYLQRGKGRGRGRGDGHKSNGPDRSLPHEGSKKQPNQATVKGKEQTALQASEERRAQASAIFERTRQIAWENERDGRSSSEEEDNGLDDEKLFSTSLKSYSTLFNDGNGRDESSSGLRRTKNLFNDICKSGALSCLICISSVRQNDAIWHCVGCYSIFHLQCIQKWAKDGASLNSVQMPSLAEAASMTGVTHKEEQHWFCPKCRYEFSVTECPTHYVCFCGKEVDPKFDPWLVPHSCGQTCGRALRPECGHSCVLLCHPGPCPPCPQVVKWKCYCGREAPVMKRCSSRDWSCGKPCGCLLSCGQHHCQQPCHQGRCLTCPRQSKQSCLCGKEIAVRLCADAVWQCSLVCGKIYSCGNHKCEKVCHSDDCGPCPRSLERTCPCGKTRVILPCTEDVSSCGDTCSKKLPCGTHRCMQLCHSGSCGLCRQMVTKTCRCGRKEKKVQCHQEYTCEIKCDRKRDCQRHQCKRKCCDGSCPPCEQPCSRTLNCRNHKCASRCHSGLCYPCIGTVDISCNCGATVLTVSCGRERRTKPPKCKELCRRSPDCHHVARRPHLCHFKKCPPCTQVCNKPLPGCVHHCPMACHDAVKNPSAKRLVVHAPWEKSTEIVDALVALPCPPCNVPVLVVCFGQHQTRSIACIMSKPFSCGCPCDRLLSCSNHKCELECHTVTGVVGRNQAGKECEDCKRFCEKSRPTGCRHNCPLLCHPGDCPLCKERLRLPCHCKSSNLFIECSEWTSAGEEKRKEMLSCLGQCPKQLSCGHRCPIKCHFGSCPSEQQCERKTTIRCTCRRRKKDVPCHEFQTGTAILNCDDKCQEAKKQTAKEKAESVRQKEDEERRHQQQELAEFQRKLEGRRRKRKEVVTTDAVELPWWRRQTGLTVGISVLFVIISLVLYMYTSQ